MRGTRIRALQILLEGGEDLLAVHAGVVRVGLDGGEEGEDRTGTGEEENACATSFYARETKT